MRTARAIAAARVRASAIPSPGPWVGLLAARGTRSGSASRRRCAAPGIEAIAISAPASASIPPPRTDRRRSRSATLAASGGTTAGAGPDPRRGGARARPPGPDDYIRARRQPDPRLDAVAARRGAARCRRCSPPRDTWLREQRADWRTRRTMFWAGERGLIPLARAAARLPARARRARPRPRVPLRPRAATRRAPAARSPSSSSPAPSPSPSCWSGRCGRRSTPSRRRSPPRPGCLTGCAILGIWLLNPYLALLLAPAAHVWLLPPAPPGPPRAAVARDRRGAVADPGAAGFATVAGELDLGLGAPWHLLLMIEGGQIGFWSSPALVRDARRADRPASQRPRAARACRAIGPRGSILRRRQPRRARRARVEPPADRRHR